MTTKKPFIIFAALLCLAATFAFIRTDDDPITKIISQLNKWTETYPQEKVYLHTDKPYYNAGEKIWFKAYLVIGENHQLSAKSAILNVELINPQDSIIRVMKLPVQSGVTWGDITLSDTLKNGSYRLRAYTNYMQNTGAEYFFDKTFVIANSVNNNVFTVVKYNYTTQNKEQKITATITYTNLNGLAYTNKDVRYDVQIAGKRVTGGSGVTDGKGTISISFINNLPGNPKGSIITHINADKRISTQILPIKATSNNVDIQFFAEGGNMVNGLRSKIAFKATGADGLGVDIKGVIKDVQNNTVATIGTAHFGMGFMFLTPESGKAYKAVITMPDGSESVVPLPEAANNGITLGVGNNDPAAVVVKVNASHAIAAKANQEVNIVAQQNGHVYYAARAKLNKPTFIAAIPKSRFPSGVVQFTLFSSGGEPLNERLIFVQNPDLLNLTVSTNKQTYHPREKVSMSLGAKNALDQAVTGSFSVAVIDESKVGVDEQAESTILSNLLLTSDLKGYVQKPNYYFTNVNDQTKTDLDALMLTQGYRRFVWKQVLNDDFPAQAYQPEKTLSISGHVTTLSGKPVVAGKITLVSTAGGGFSLDTLTDAQGKFNFNNLVFTDSVKVTVQARDKNNGSNIRLVLDNLPATKAMPGKNTADIEFGLNNFLQAYLQNGKKQFDEYAMALQVKPHY
jgi:hypothetical protein